MKRITKVSLLVYLVILVTVYAVSTIRGYGNIKKIEAIEKIGTEIYSIDGQKALKNPDGSNISVVMINGKPYLPMESVAGLTGLEVYIDNKTINFSTGNNGCQIPIQ